MSWRGTTGTPIDSAGSLVERVGRLGQARVVVAVLQADLARLSLLSPALLASLRCWWLGALPPLPQTEPSLRRLPRSAFRPAAVELGVRLTLQVCSPSSPHEVQKQVSRDRCASRYTRGSASQASPAEL